MAFDRHGNYVARIGSILLRQSYGARLDTGNTKSEVIPGGNLDRSAVVTSHADPTLKLTTQDLDSVIGGGISIGSGYLADTTAALTDASLFQMQKRVDGGTFAAAGGLLHHVITSVKGFCVIDEIRASQDDPEGAQIDLNYFPYSQDGQTVPLTATGISALVSTPLFGGIWYLGPVWLDVGGTPLQVHGVQRVSIRPGIRCDRKRANGEAFTSHCAIMSRLPEIRITLCDALSFYTRFNSYFGVASAVNLSCYFQKGVHGGVRVAKAGASHVRVYAATGDITADEISVDRQEDGMVEFTFRPNALLAASNGVAIQT